MSHPLNPSSRLPALGCWDDSVCLWLQRSEDLMGPTYHSKSTSSVLAGWVAALGSLPREEGRMPA